jgi:NOL1/NOP2/sun family putative RNA methylase
MDYETKKLKFLQKLKEIFPDNYEEVITRLESPPPVAFRINTLKISKDKALGELEKEGFELEEGPVENSYIIVSSSKRLSETAAFENGLIYIQSLSSMLPVIALEPNPGEKVLDLCAAPGSKTSQIAEKTGNGVDIVAVENNRNRFFALQNNLKNLGVKNVKVILSDARIIDKKYPEMIEHFDKILVDAPCSNEGLINPVDPRTLALWNPKLPKKLSKLQKSLLAAAVRLLKPGGTLVYSTCTFSKEENELVAEWLVKRFPEMKLEEFKRITPDEYFTGFALTKLVKSL